MAIPAAFAKKPPKGAKKSPFAGKETAKEEKAEGKKMPPWLSKGPAMKGGGKVKC